MTRHNAVCRVQILVQIQQTAVQSQRALQVCQQQTASKDRERRILQLTIDEISQIKEDVNMYKGVGKMHVSCRLIVQHHINLYFRFMIVPRKTMEEELKSQEKELTDDISNLNKKVRLSVDTHIPKAHLRFQSKYLEKQLNEAQSQLRDIFHHGSNKQ
ncbi:hypothetical protein H0H92_013900 [Tricholoma furcatifolium]|nr:hypothetical protein H0H92_013900 [Tricholoma furcatifolium]